jgi:hypothetical protein
MLPIHAIDKSFVHMESINEALQETLKNSLSFIQSDRRRTYYMLELADGSHE